MQVAWKQKYRIWMLVAVAAIVASGCIKVDLTVDVADDGSATVEGLTAFNFEAISSLTEDLGEDFAAGEDEICGGDASTEFGLDENEFDSVEAFNEDGFCGVRFSASYGADEVDQALGGFDTSEDSTLRRDGDGWFFEQTFAADEFDTGDVPLPGIDDILGDAEYIVRVRLPGEQVEHNGEIDSEGFVIWDIDITNPPERIFLRTEPGQRITGNASVGGGGDDGGSALTVILIVVAVLAALGIAAWFLMRNRNEPQAAPASGIAATIPGAGAPPTAGGPPPVVSPPGDFSAGAAPPQTDPAGGFSAPAAPPAQPPSTPEAIPAPAAPAPGSPTPEEATGQPVWDPNRSAYVQWDPGNNRWLIHDQASGAWRPE